MLEDVFNSQGQSDNIVCTNPNKDFRGWSLYIWRWGYGKVKVLFVVLHCHVS